jgi:hypothetical protein
MQEGQRKSSAALSRFTLQHPSSLFLIREIRTIRVPFFKGIVLARDPGRRHNVWKSLASLGGNNMPVSSRWLLSAVALTAITVSVVCPSRPIRMVEAADPPRESPRVTVYDPNPRHLWNRLHEALQVRLDGEGWADPGDLDPFLWQSSPYGEKGERYKRAAAVLDEFIAQKGDRLIADPRKRALLQRDLWVFFDTVGLSRFLLMPGKTDGEIELAARAAKILPRLALTPDQIKALPDNFAETVAARKLPSGYDADRLWDADGPWVLLGSEERLPLPATHVEFFGGRSAFFVLVRLPDGREQTKKYLAELRRTRSAPKPPPGGVYFALVRQMQLIDTRGRITLTPVIETLQFRGLGEQELKLSRKDFTAGKASLLPVGPEDRERNFIARLGRNAGDGRVKVLSTCGGCHTPDTMQSHVRHFPPSQSISPSLVVSDREEESLRARIWKVRRYEWGLLQGLLLTPSRE